MRSGFSCYSFSNASSRTAKRPPCKLRWDRATAGWMASLAFTANGDHTMLATFRLLFTTQAVGNWYVNVYSEEVAGLGSGIGGGSGWQVPPTTCTSSINSTSASVGAAGGTGSVAVAAGAGCEWMAATSASWIGVTGFKGTGAGTVTFKVNANTGTTPRSATINIFGQTFTVNQAGT